MSRLDDVLENLHRFIDRGASAADVATSLTMNRSTASRYLNELVKLEKAVKVAGKPVRYQPLSTSGVTISESLQPLMEQGMAALSYPFQSLHILLDGETGTGKTYLAEKLYEMAMQRSYIEAGTPFISFNCADYAHNPELLVGQVFGMRKGAYTGASQDTQGLVEQANGGILFLDEIHRLSEAGQEMLFYLLDKGVYRRLGEATRERTAKLTLIAATTEAPHNVLLPTLLRRLSLHLTVPPLRQRPRQERSDLLNHFLHAEEEKMDASLSIDDSGRELLLTYACPGNIGQLKSDIQIACARAYLHYLNNGLSEVVIKDDFLPIKRSLNGKTADADSEPVSIYERLNELHINVLSSNQKTVEDTLQYVVNEYIEDLLTHQSREKLESGAWLNLIDADLLQTLQQAPFPLVKGSSIKLDEKRLYVIGLHLQNYRKHRHGHSSTLPAISRAPAEELEAARQLALHAQQSIGLSLPEEEINLIAHFLRTEPSDNNPWANQSVYVLLVTHGRAAASSMAEVTNTLLGTHVIEAVDMPLDVSAEQTYEHVRKRIDTAVTEHSYNGILLLVDMGSLVTMGDTLTDWNLPIHTLSCVNMPMVLEAGRKSLVEGITAHQVYEAAYDAMTVFMRHETAPSLPKKKRVIATVCFTGEGAAQLLEEWIASQLTTADDDVVIRTVRVDPVTRDTSLLYQLKDYYEMIAIIGTVSISMDEVPFIPAWELLKEEGSSRLFKLLEMTRKYDSSHTEPENVLSEDSMCIIEPGLNEIVSHLDAALFCKLLDEHIPGLRKYYDWEFDRSLGMSMHIGVFIDRMLDAQMNNEEKKLISTIPAYPDLKVLPEEYKLWFPFLKQIEVSFHIFIPDEFLRGSVKLAR